MAHARTLGEVGFPTRPSTRQALFQAQLSREELLLAPGLSDLNRTGIVPAAYAGRDRIERRRIYDGA